MPSTGEVVVNGAVALMASATVFLVIWRRQYFTDITVAGRSELRARLPSWSRWLVPAFTMSPWYLKAQLLFGVIVTTAVAACFWVAFVAGMVAVIRGGRG